jgi:hypothetical protein
MIVPLTTWPEQTEADIQSAILEYLALRGETGIQRTNSGRVAGVELAAGGTADLTGYLRRHPRYRGKFCAIEVKRPGWKPRNKGDRDRYARQLAYLEDVRAAGGIGILAYGVEDVVRGLA